MTIDTNIMQAVITGATVLGTEFAKGLGGEAAKSSWTKIKTLLGWDSDPAPTEIRAKITQSISESPEIVEEIRRLLEQAYIAEPHLVGKIDANNSKVVVSGSIDTVNM